MGRVERDGTTVVSDPGWGDHRVAAGEPAAGEICERAGDVRGMCATGMAGPRNFRRGAKRVRSNNSPDDASRAPIEVKDGSFYHEHMV